MCYNRCSFWNGMSERCTAQSRGMAPCEEKARALAMKQTDHLCPECQMAGRDHRYLHEALAEDGNDTYCCPVCEKAYPLAEWFDLMAEAYDRRLDACDELRSGKLAVEHELRTIRQLLDGALEELQTLRSASLPSPAFHGLSRPQSPSFP